MKQVHKCNCTEYHQQLKWYRQLPLPGVRRVEVEGALQSLNIKKSDGWYRIWSMALIIGASEWSIPLTILYTVMLVSPAVNACYVEEG